MSIRQFRRKRKKESVFKPNRAYIVRAIEDYLKEGGTIKKIIIDPNSYNKFVGMKDIRSVDQFLSGG